MTTFAAVIRRTRAAASGGPGIGLALGGGGARGLAHVGVVNELAHQGIPIRAIAGTSSGALVGAMYAAGQIENFERRMRSFQWSDVIALFDPVWPRSGLISGNRILDTIAGPLGDWRIEDLPIPFAAVCVDLMTGEEVWIRSGRVIDAIRASISIPGIFIPRVEGKQVLVDGVLRNPVPVSTVRALGCDVTVAVNLQSRIVPELPSVAVTSRIAAPLPEPPQERRGRLWRRGRRGANASAEEPMPNILEILTASMSVLSAELAQHRLARESADVRIEPDLGGIRTHEFHRAAEAIEAGRRAAIDALPGIERARRRRRLLRKLRSAQ
jgi:NTE family protein